MDFVDQATRSRMMATVRSANTRPEMIVRKFLHAHGYRFRLHQKMLPGKPDIVMPKYRTCIFVHGCFWHHHSGCRYATMPKTRFEFWNEKLLRNVARDTENVKALELLGWRVLIIWECQLKKGPDTLNQFLQQLCQKQKGQT
ncbi:very short patch repair endonuclease [Pseudomonas sp. 18058]|uniref:very short patch repair endonuclease n=1 Tax=Pseudomonas sp. 18058 TaxID=2681406 RepID=UPI00135C46F0|nr:very short patch repair endonuclease [Pseudomonas sp. 18058]